MSIGSPVVDVSRASSTGEPLRLNLGGRTTNIPGFKTVDLYGGSNVDIATDVSDLSMIGDRTVKTIYASHILEHFPHVKTQDVLKEWYRVMEPGGKVYIAVPDFEAVVKIYVQDGLTEWMRNFLYGDQEYDKAFHYTSFDFSSLSLSLVKAGFYDVKRIPQMPYGLADCSKLRYSRGSIPVSLNVVAFA
jgi:hypothetical protein